MDTINASWSDTTVLSFCHKHVLFTKQNKNKRWSYTQKKASCCCEKLSIWVNIPTVVVNEHRNDVILYKSHRLPLYKKSWNHIDDDTEAMLYTCIQYKDCNLVYLGDWKCDMWFFLFSGLVMRQKCNFDGKICYLPNHTISLMIEHNYPVSLPASVFYTQLKPLGIKQDGCNLTSLWRKSETWPTNRLGKYSSTFDDHI